MNRKRILQIAAVATLLSAFAMLNRPRGAQASQPLSHPLITRLVARDLTIRISAGPGGPLYSATDRAGKPLATNLTLDELQALHPELHKQIESGVCDTAPTPWAGIDRD